jgi:Lar family restriction alleviation protein
MKNCPFCGHTATCYSNKNGRVGRYAQVRCSNKECRARGPVITTNIHYRDTPEHLELVKTQTKEQAVRSWNARTM